MHDVAVALDHHLLGDLDAADRGHAAHVVPREVQQHQMLGAFLGIGEQLRGEALILLECRTPAARAGERAQAHRAAAHAHQDFRARADHGEGAEIEEEQERRGIERRSAR